MRVSKSLDVIPKESWGSVKLGEQRPLLVFRRADVFSSRKKTKKISFGNRNQGAEIQFFQMFQLSGNELPVCLTQMQFDPIERSHNATQRPHSAPADTSGRHVLPHRLLFFPPSSSSSSFHSFFFFFLFPLIANTCRACFHQLLPKSAAKSSLLFPLRSALWHAVEHL